MKDLIVLATFSMAWTLQSHSSVEWRPFHSSVTVVLLDCLRNRKSEDSVKLWFSLAVLQGHHDAYVTFISVHPPSFEPTCRDSMLAISTLITNDIAVRLRGSLPRSVNGRQGGSNITIRQSSFLEQATDSSFDFHAESGYTLYSSALCTKTSSYWLVR